MPIFDNTDKVNLERLVFTALGAASSCWENVKGAGEFDQAYAKDIGDELVELLRTMFKAKDEPTVPVVAYVDGRREVLGEAVVHADGTLDATMYEDRMNYDTRNMFCWVGDVSLGLQAKTLEKPGGSVTASRKSRRAAEEWLDSMGWCGLGEKSDSSSVLREE